MYADVVVLTYQAPDINYFTYKIPKTMEKQIKIGQLVEVPFGKRNPLGIVVAIQDKKHETRNKIKIRNLNKILLPQPLLFPYQIEVLKWMSSYYLAPTVNCLEAMLPKMPARAAQLEGLPTARRLKTENLITNELSNLALAGGKVATGPVQTMVLVPSINHISETLAKFPKAKNYTIYHNELKTSEKFSAWQKILSGDADLIFGSRLAIFAPCPNLKEIIIYNEHDGAYKDERSPYFDTLTVAQKIAQLTGAQIKIVDPAPKVTTYFQLAKHIKIQNFPQKIEIINMQSNQISGNKSPISFDLEEAIKEVLEKKGNILLFLNRKKEAGHLFCKSCKASIYLEQQPGVCPNCSAPDIFWNVLNIKSLASEVKKSFPNTGVTLLANQRGLNPTPRVGSLIDIDTAHALYSPLLKKYDLVAHIQTDSLLNVADFTSGEKLFAQVTNLKKLLTPDGHLVLQTYNKEHPTLAAIEKGDYLPFFQSELKQRKALWFPPYSLLIKLTLRGKLDTKVKTAAERLSQNLRSTIHDSQFTSLGPYQSVFWQKNPTYHIILKHQISDYCLKEREKVIKKMSAYLEKGSKKYTIEVEPEGVQ